MKFSKKSIIVPALGALCFGGVGVGATFALFTDKAETTVSVRAGVVAISTEIELVSYKSLDLAEPVLVPASTTVIDYGIGGSVVKGNDGSLTITNWVPGDQVTFRVSVINGSTIKTKWRLRLASSGTLAEALEDNFPAAPSLWQVAEACPLMNDAPVPTPLMDPVEVTLSFPNTNNNITSRQQGVDNQYQGTDCTYLVIAEAVQGNAVVSNMQIADFAQSETVGK